MGFTYLNLWFCMDQIETIRHQSLLVIIPSLFNKLEEVDVENGIWGKEKGREERGGGEKVDFQSWVLGEGEG